jgi:hypothetical protein
MTFAVWVWIFASDPISALDAFGPTDCNPSSIVVVQPATLTTRPIFCGVVPTCDGDVGTLGFVGCRTGAEGIEDDADIALAACGTLRAAPTLHSTGLATGACAATGGGTLGVCRQTSLNFDPVIKKPFILSLSAVKPL